jgi:chromate reductase
MTGPVRLLLVSGSTRARSTNTAALRTACAVAPASVTATLYEGLAELPAFNPDEDGSGHPAVRRLRQALSEADGVLFCTPEYAGSLPGSLKNLLDWTVGSGELYGKPVAWVNVAAEGRGKGAEEALASVLGYVGAVVITQACLRLPLARQSVGPEGTAVDVEFRAALAQVLQAMVDELTTAPANDDRS